MLDNLEEVLITSDVGVDTTLKIIDRIEKRVARDKYVTTQELTTLLRDEIASLLTENNTEDAEGFALPEGKKPYVIMVVGVNGVGKTTTIGKLAYQSRKPARRSIWRRRYVPCRRRGAVGDLERAGRRTYREAEHGLGPRFRGFRYAELRQGERCRRGDYRYRRTSA